MRTCRHCGASWEDSGEHCSECDRNYGGAKFPETETAEELREIEERIQQIHAAFALVSLGGGETIHQGYHEIYARDDPEWLAFRKKDPENHWTEVPGSKLTALSEALWYIDPKGWRFYLPAFLCWILRNWRTDDTLTLFHVISTLSDPHAYRTERYQLLDRAQSEAVFDFLTYLDRYAGEDSAAEAIQAYWYQFRRG